LRLTKSGVPWEVAISLSPAELLGYCIAAGEIDGGHFNWAEMRWSKPD
jgi:hypothetical protein